MLLSFLVFPNIPYCGFVPELFNTKRLRQENQLTMFSAIKLLSLPFQINRREWVITNS